MKKVLAEIINRYRASEKERWAIEAINVLYTEVEVPMELARYEGDGESKEDTIDGALTKSQIQIFLSDLLSLSACYGHINVIRLLIEKGMDIKLLPETFTPLHWAAFKGHSNVLELFVEKGVVLDIQDKGCYTPICLAAKYGHRKIVELLLVKGANTKIGDRWQYLPVHWAAENGHLEIIKVFIDFKQEIAPLADGGITPLHLAAIGGHDSVIELLIKNGGDINVQDNYGCTPLHYSTFFKHPITTLLLLNLGADPKIEDIDKMSIIDIALEEEEHSIIDIIKFLDEHYDKSHRDIDLLRAALDYKSTLWQSYFLFKLGLYTKDEIQIFSTKEIEVLSLGILSDSYLE